MTLTKADLAAILHEKIGLSKRDSNDMVDIRMGALKSTPAEYATPGDAPSRKTRCGNAAGKTLSFTEGDRNLGGSE